MNLCLGVYYKPLTLAECIHCVYYWIFFTTETQSFTHFCALLFMTNGNISVASTHMSLDRCSSKAIIKGVTCKFHTIKH